jgi:hypothetical protein
MSVSLQMKDGFKCNLHKGRGGWGETCNNNVGAVDLGWILEKLFGAFVESLVDCLVL